MEQMKEMIDELVRSDNLLVVANTLPLYIMSQMFFAGECVMGYENQEITQKVFELIENHIMQLKNNT